MVLETRREEKEGEQELTSGPVKVQEVDPTQREGPTRVVLAKR